MVRQILGLVIPLTLGATAGVSRGDDMAISAGAGLTGFSDSTTDNFVKDGGAWDVRLILGTNARIGAELAYVGSLQDLNLPRLDATLMGTGFEGNIRLNLGVLPVQPYLLAGAGWIHYDVDVEGMDVNVGDDDIMTVPLGVGVSFQPGPALIDLRGTYRMAFDDELLRDQQELEGEDSLDSWSVTGRVGVMF